MGEQKWGGTRPQIGGQATTLPTGSKWPQKGGHWELGGKGDGLVLRTADWNNHARFRSTRLVEQFGVILDLTHVHTTHKHEQFGVILDLTHVHTTHKHAQQTLTANGGPTVRLATEIEGVRWCNVIRSCESNLCSHKKAL